MATPGSSGRGGWDERPTTLSAGSAGQTSVNARSAQASPTTGYGSVDTAATPAPFTNARPPSRVFPPWLIVLAAIVLLLSLLFGFLAYANADDPSVPDVVRRVEPSVVSIFTRDGLGSGVIWSSDGLIVTDHHVVVGNEQVEVAFADGRRAPARVLAGDPVTDLAVLQAERTGLPQATFEAERPEVGEQAIAIGTP